MSEHDQQTSLRQTGCMPNVQKFVWRCADFLSLMYCIIVKFEAYKFDRSQQTISYDTSLCSVTCGQSTGHQPNTQAPESQHARIATALEESIFENTVTTMQDTIFSLLGIYSPTDGSPTGKISRKIRRTLASSG